MVKMTLAVCDRPGCDEKGAAQYEIRYPDGVLALDLCSDHAGPLDELREAVPKSLFLKHGQRKKAVRVQMDPDAIS